MIMHTFISDSYEENRIFKLFINGFLLFLMVLINPPKLTIIVIVFKLNMRFCYDNQKFCLVSSKFWVGVFV